MLTSIVSWSYAISFMAFTILFLLIVTVWRERPLSNRIALASLLTLLWAFSVILHVEYQWTSSIWVASLELIRSAAWIALLFELVKPIMAGNLTLGDPAKNRLLSYKWAVLLFFVIQIVCSLLSGFHSLESNLLTLPFQLLIGSEAKIANAVVGMLLVEQYFRNTNEKGRWGIKFACLGIGGLFAYDFYLYSDALLFQKIDREIWTARGVVNALTVPLIAVSLARNPKWSQGLLVSRRVLFHSATLFGAAFYLLAMAAAGYYLRYFGGSWGTALQVAFLFGALVLLLVLLFSGSVRAWLRVFISKHFYSYNYDYREEWMKFTRTFTIQDKELQERAIQALAELVESPAGVLFIRKEMGYCVPVKHWNMPTSEASESSTSPFCRLLEEKQWVVDLQNLDSQADVYENISIPSWVQKYPRAWLVLPLVLHGKLFGFIVLAQARSPVRLNWEVLDLLKIASSQAASYLAQQESANELLVAKQFDSFNRMSTFMVHDLKNLVSQLSLLLTNAEKHRHNPEFQKDMIETIDNSVQKMKYLLQKLSRGVSAEQNTRIDLVELLKETVDSKSPYEPKPTLEITPGNAFVNANRERLERVIGHVIQNAIDATPSSGDVGISLRWDSSFAVVEVNDTGSGMSDDFVKTKLFAPFVSTKPAGMGIGVFETREYIEELGGRLKVVSQPNVGTTFEIFIPVLELEKLSA
jgi:putative PEP-CTERM system histidine kinase